MKPNESAYSILTQLKKNIALWGTIAFILIAVIPTVAGVPDPYLKILISIGTSLFVALTVSYFTNKKIASATNFEVKNLINDKFPKLLQIEEIGLEKIVYENNMDSVGVDLSEPSDLYIAMNDGKNFFTNNSRKLSDRFKKEHKRTTIVLMSPESDSERILNIRNGKEDAGYYANKIKDAKKDYIEFHKDAPSTNVLEIRFFRFNISMSVVATENIALVGLYRNSVGKSLTPPSFLFKDSGDSCEYSNIIKDIKSLIAVSDIAWSSETNKNNLPKEESNISLNPQPIGAA